MDLGPQSLWVCPNCSMDFNSTQQLSLHMNKFCPNSHHVRGNNKFLQNGSDYSPVIADIDRAPNSIIREVKLLVKKYEDGVPAKILKRLIENYHLPSYDYVSSDGFVSTFVRDQWLETVDLLESLYGPTIPTSVVLRAFTERGHEGLLSDTGDERERLEANHKRNLARIYADRLMLAQQRQTLENKLSSADIGSLAQPENSSKFLSISTTENHLLSSLQAQGARNHEALESIKSQIENLVSKQQAAKLEATSSGKANHQVFDEASGKFVPAPYWFTDSVVDDVIRLRRSYLREGGADKRILNQLADLQVEAMLAENARIGESAVGEDGPAPRLIDQRYPVRDKLTTLEKENKKLLRKLDAAYNGHDESGNDNSASKDDILNIKKSLARLAAVHEEMASSKQETELAKLSQDVEELRHQRREDHIPAISPIPYSNPDEAVSFTVFYDFIKGLDFSLKAVRLVVSLFDGHQQCGGPTILPEVTTEQASPVERSLSAMVGARQPILRVWASPAVSVVIEIQGNNGLNTKFSTVGWTKCNMFDRQGLLLDGMWRQPFKIIPIYPAISSNDLFSIPDAGSAALYFRLVGQQNLGSQSSVNVSLSRHTMYSTLPYFG